MRSQWPIVTVFILGLLVGRLLGPWTQGCGPEGEQPPPASKAPPGESDPDASVVSDALAFIETLDREELPEGGEWTMCVRVIDGDTIESEGGERVRYIGMDTPETGHPRLGLQPFGLEASEVNRALVEGEEVYLLGDITDRDRYGRLLRYVYTQDGLFVNLALVAAGLARVATYPPDVMHVEEYIAAQEEAREAARGMWGVELDSAGIPVDDISKHEQGGTPDE